VREKLSTLWAKVKVVLGAAPFWGAAAVGLLTSVQLEVVPLLPGPWQVRAGAAIATALAIVGAIVRTVARVTPVPPAQRGLLP
jgi:hypothetical protein